MNSIYSYFKKHNILLKENIVFLTTPSLIYKHIIEFKVDKDVFTSNNFDNAFFDAEFYCEDRLISGSKDLQEFIDLDKSVSTYNFSFIKEIPFDSEDNNFYFYNYPGVKIFLKEFSKVKIEKIKDLKNKLNIKTFIKDNKYQSYSNKSTALFNFNENSNFEEIDPSVIKFIKTFAKTKAIIGLVPNYLDSQSMRDMPIITIIKAILALLSNDQTQKKYYFKGKFNLTLHCNKEYDISRMLHHYNDLQKIFTYIFNNAATSDQKKTFFRKILCDPLTQDEDKEISDISDDYFKEVFRDTQYLFETYENDEISVFLKEKKEIMKEYVSISKDIISNINSIKINLNRNLLTFLSVIFINFALKIFSGTNTEELIDFILYIAIFYISLIIALFIMNDVPLYVLLKRRVKAFENQFKFLSSKADTIKIELKNLSASELRVYCLLLAFTFIIYVSILIFLIFYMPTLVNPTSK